MILHRPPIDCLKIDQHFVQRLDQDASTAAIVHTIIELARPMPLADLLDWLRRR